MTTSAHSFILHEGRRYPLSFIENRGWRLRSRSKSSPVDVLLGHGPEKWAKARAREILTTSAHKPKACNGTLKDLVAAYEGMPKRAGVDAARIAIYRLTSCVRLVYGRELDAVKVAEIGAAFWLKYTAKRQGREVADLATRRVDASAINAAMRQAASIFIPRLRPSFTEAGFQIREDATVIQWLPAITMDKPAVTDGMEKAWLKMERGPLWLALGLARYAGLRRDEIEHVSASWIQVEGAATYIVLQDRPAENWLSKTGRKYRALVIQPELAATLRACSTGYIVQPASVDRSKWFAMAPQKWMRDHTTARQPLHRLRGLYADHVARLTSDAITARLAGIQAASDSLGHTSTATTTKHYLSDALR